MLRIVFCSVLKASYNRKSDGRGGALAYIPSLTLSSTLSLFSKSVTSEQVITTSQSKPMKDSAESSSWTALGFYSRERSSSSVKDLNGSSLSGHQLFS